MGIAGGRSQQLGARVTSHICSLLAPHQGGLGSLWVPTLVIVGTGSWGCRRGAGAVGMLLVRSPWA